MKTTADKKIQESVNGPALTKIRFHVQLPFKVYTSDEG